MGMRIPPPQPPSLFPTLPIFIPGVHLSSTSPSVLFQSICPLLHPNPFPPVRFVRAGDLLGVICSFPDRAAAQSPEELLRSTLTTSEGAGGSDMLYFRVTEVQAVESVRDPSGPLRVDPDSTQIILEAGSLWTGMIVTLS